MRYSPRLLLALCAIGSFLPAASAGIWSEPASLPHDGLLRWFRYYVPDSQPVAGYPVVVMLHGGSGSMHQLVDWSAFAEWQEIAEEQGILLLAPNGVNAATGDTAGDNQRWNDCRADQTVNRSDADDIGFLKELLDWAEANYTLDPNRIYFVGESNGGFMSYRVAAELGHRVAAVAAFIANQPVHDACNGYSHPVSVMICNGDEDNYIPWAGGCGSNDEECARGRTRSGLESRDFWVDLLNAGSVPDLIVDHANTALFDGSTVRSERYFGGVDGTEVRFYQVVGGGHNTPTTDHMIPGVTRALLGLGNQNRDVEGAREAWSFFQAHTLYDASPRDAAGSAGGLAVSKVAGGLLQLEWSPDCGIGDRYGVYRGKLDVGYESLVPEGPLCGVDATTVQIPMGPNDADFFLIVPNDGVLEGSYGLIGEQVQRAGSPAACLPQSEPAACSTVGL